jgi:hypothetical protein
MRQYWILAALRSWLEFVQSPASPLGLVRFMEAIISSGYPFAGQRTPISIDILLAVHTVPLRSNRNDECYSRTVRHNPKATLQHTPSISNTPTMEWLTIPVSIDLIHNQQTVPANDSTRMAE